MIVKIDDVKRQFNRAHRVIIDHLHSTTTIGTVDDGRIVLLADAITAWEKIHDVRVSWDDGTMEFKDQIAFILFMLRYG